MYAVALSRLNGGACHLSVKVTSLGLSDRIASETGILARQVQASGLAIRFGKPVDVSTELEPNYVRPAQIE